MNKQERRRASELGITIGRYSTGKYNAITDVKGVRVGHSTIIQGDPNFDPPSKIARTGVTAIFPNDDTYLHSVTGGGFILNGAGELSGITQVLEWGIIETPILLTNTFAVGACSQALVKYYLKKHPEIGTLKDVIIPLVGECDDSWLNGITGQHVRMRHVFDALNSARSGPVAEGNVGGGTGMITCEFKGGIGTSSRRLAGDLHEFTVGVLVMSNFGRMGDLRMEGMPIGLLLQKEFEHLSKREFSYGSIITVVATDAPLNTPQLNRLAKRAALGIARAGSIAAHGSGEIVIAFSTSNVIKRDAKKLYYSVKVLHDDKINPLYEAVMDATEEAILNAICMGDGMIGVNKNYSPGLPLDEVQKIVERVNKSMYVSRET